MNTFFKDKQGNPFFLLGLQAHNSSTGTDLIKKTIHAIKLYGGNTIEAPIYWNKIEPEMNTYSMDLVRGLIDAAREAELKLVILWFGASKNSHPNYAPDYIKLDPQKYQIAIGASGAPVASLSPHCRETLNRDAKAFEEVMKFVKEYDSEIGTVVAMQIENEFGYANTDRDYSKLATSDYQKEVPNDLCNVELEDCGEHDCSKTWRGLFGRHAHEAFSSYYHALYIEEMAKIGKKIYNIPMIINIFIGETNIEEAGYCYNAGAGVGRVLDIWKITAPSLDLICPDIYLSAKREYLRVAQRYNRPDNALFIPECEPSGEAGAMNILLAVADYAAIGVCGFGAETTLTNDGELLPAARTMAISMRAIANLSPLLIKYRNTGRVHAFVQDEFSTSQYLRHKKYHITANFSLNNPRFTAPCSRINLKSPENGLYLQERGRGLLIEGDDNDFFIAGAGIGFEITERPSPTDEKPFIHLSSRQSSQLNFLSVEEGHFNGDTWVTDYTRNGDESNFLHYSHGGQVVRIRMNPNTGMNIN